MLNRPNEDGGGGVALYIRNNHNFKIRNDLFVEVEKDNVNKMVSVSYKPPKINTELLDRLQNNMKNCYIAGDFNIDLLKSDSNAETNAFVDTLFSYSFFPSNYKTYKNYLRYCHIDR